MPFDNSINNLTRLKSPSSIPITGNGQAARDAAGINTKLASEPMVRNLPPLTKYNAESGIAEPIEENDIPLEQDAPSPVLKKETSDRHNEWKKQQAEKSAQIAEKKVAKQASSQVLAKDLLRKGDLIGAANALGMSPADLSTYVTNAALGLQPAAPEEKQLSPEQQRAADEEKFRNDRLSFEKEQREWRYSQIATKYIEKNIDPLLADQDRFEYIHKVADPQNIKNYAYEYMDKHFRETCTFNQETNSWNADGEQLNPADVLETIENNFYTEHVASLERAKGIKKVSKYFSAPVAPPKEEVFSEEAAPIDADPWAQHSKRNISLSNVRNPDRVRPSLDISQDKPMDFSEEETSQKEAEPAPAPKSKISKPWRSMSRAEQLAQIRREEDEAARKRR